MAIKKDNSQPLALDQVKVDSFYFRSNICEILRSEGLTYSRPMYDMWLLKKVFTEPDRKVGAKNKMYVIFTGAEVIDIVSKIRKYYEDKNEQSES